MNQIFREKYKTELHPL